MKVLVIDDDPVLIHLVTARLKRRGVEVTVAFDAAQATVQVLRNQPDAVLLDINLPGGTGFAVLRRIRSSTRTAVLPVFLMSASSGPSAADIARLGADGFFTKPLDFDRLDQALCAIAAASSAPAPVIGRAPAAEMNRSGLPPVIARPSSPARSRPHAPVAARP